MAFQDRPIRNSIFENGQVRLEGVTDHSRFYLSEFFLRGNFIKINEFFQSRSANIKMRLLFHLYRAHITELCRVAELSLTLNGSMTFQVSEAKIGCDIIVRLNECNITMSHTSRKIYELMKS